MKLYMNSWQDKLLEAGVAHPEEREPVKLAPPPHSIIEMLQDEEFVGQYRQWVAEQDAVARAAEDAEEQAEAEALALEEALAEDQYVAALDNTQDVREFVMLQEAIEEALDSDYSDSEDGLSD
jgi:hypothetical protein